MTLQYRPAEEDDADGIARVHVSGWRTTYVGLIPDETLANLSVERRAEAWTESITRGANYIFVVVDGEEIVGFVAGGPEREETLRRTDRLPFDGELYALYILEEFQRRGIGTELFRLLAAALVMAGFSRMLVWVLTENELGCRFYEARGGVFETRRVVRIVGVDLEETGYGWELPVDQER
ncbi:MAG TPA: GNAT family N-acetyltransferase [Anaerolineales bacterium]|nr:GNAT family N-acetyltransferase [Anaerolineales bacterium]